MEIKNYRLYDKRELVFASQDIDDPVMVDRGLLPEALPYVDYRFSNGKTFLEQFPIMGAHAYGEYLATGYVQWDNAEAELTAFSRAYPDKTFKIHVVDAPHPAFWECPDITSEEWKRDYVDVFFGDIQVWIFGNSADMFIRVGDETPCLEHSVAMLPHKEKECDTIPLRVWNITNVLSDEDTERRPNKIGSYYFPVFKTQRIVSYTEETATYVTEKKPEPPSEMALGKFIQKSLSVMYKGLSESILQQVISHVRNTIQQSITTLRIDSDYDDFYRAYNSGHCSSCMTECAYDVAEFYADRVQRSDTRYVAIATLRSISDEIMARCLLWVDNDLVVIDRRYGREDYQKTLLEKLKEKYPNAAVRIGPCKESKEFEGMGLGIANQMAFPVDTEMGFPYLDTFADLYINSEGENTLVVGYTLKDTDGFNTGTECRRCGERFDPDDWGIVIHDEYNYCCEDCAHEDGWYECSHCGNWINEDDGECIECIDGNIYCCEECAENEGYQQCDNCSKWYHKNDEDCVDTFDTIDTTDGIFREDYHYCCEDCAIEDGFMSCDYCKKFYRRGTGFELDDQFYCSKQCAQNDGMSLEEIEDADIEMNEETLQPATA